MDLTLAEITASPGKWNGQVITVRGFLYDDQQGHTVLASEPALSSCCVGKKTHLFLQGAFPHPLPLQVVEVKGTLSSNTLENAQIVSGNGFGLGWLLIPVLILLALPVFKAVLKRF